MRKAILFFATLGVVSLAAVGAARVLAPAAEASEATSAPVPWCSDYRPALNQNVP